MAYTFEELKKNTVAQLRAIAKEIDHEAVQGYTQLNKDHLLEAICKALNLDMHVHHEVVGVDKSSIKKRIREFKKQRDAALESKDKVALRKARHEIRNLKKTLRRATV
ncbi:MAG: hypothetical protein DWQ05_22195 [Calditrichaeota bacterium]|nr:MAG: hypothetical protein DWQ05_22195 [Calditrichota bacterium]